jgi:hypothetical protein
MFKLEKHPNGYASIIGHGLQSQDVRTVSYAEGERLVATFDTVECGLREDLRIQIEAKCAAIKRVESFEFGQMALVDFFRNNGAEYGRFGDDKLWTPQETAAYALNDLMSKHKNQSESIRTLSAQRDSLVTAIRESQKILADYLGDRTAKDLTHVQMSVLRRDVLTELLGVLDHRDLVTLVNELPATDAPDPKPSWVYAPPYATHLFNTIGGWRFGKLTEGGYYIDADSEVFAAEMWNGMNIIAGSLEKRPGSPFVVEADKVTITGALVSDPAPVVNNTVNHFAPMNTKLKRKNRKLKATVKHLKEEIAELERPWSEMSGDELQTVRSNLYREINLRK